jgi:glutamine synthetase
MKDWAMEKGATHYTHLFQPMTGITAEKHDSFLAPDGDGGAIAEFSGKELIKGEPDASVVPLRRHPRHVRGPRLHRLGPDQPRLHPGEPQRLDALSSRRRSSRWTGEALDKKTPLLRSMEALSARPCAS